MNAIRIQRVEAPAGYRLRLALSNGRTVERDLSHLLPGPDASPTNVLLRWRDPAYFARVVSPRRAVADGDVAKRRRPGSGRVDLGRRRQRPLARAGKRRDTMTCPTCQTGHTTAGTATNTLERGDTLVVVRHVPADLLRSVWVDILCRRHRGAAARCSRRPVARASPFR